MNPRYGRRGFAWLEFLLIVTAITLLLQIWPGFGSMLLFAVDVRNWTRGVWFTANSLIVLLLIGIRFGPNILNDWRNRREEAAAEKARLAKAIKKKQEKEALQRLQESRSRRIY